MSLLFIIIMGGMIIIESAFSKREIIRSRWYAELYQL